MQRFYEEISYEAVAGNSKKFNSAVKIYNMALNIDIDNCNIINIIKNIVNIQLHIANIPMLEQAKAEHCSNNFQNELTFQRMMLVRTIIFQSMKCIGTSENATNPMFGDAIRFLWSQEFHDKIEGNDVLKMRMKVYDLLLNADREKLSVQEAFTVVNLHMEAFQKAADEQPVQSQEGAKDSKLREAIENLVRVCLRDTEDPDHCEEMLIKFSFQEIFTCLCNDIIDGKFNASLLETTS